MTENKHPFGADPWRPSRRAKMVAFLFPIAWAFWPAWHLRNKFQQERGELAHRDALMAQVKETDIVRRIYTSGCASIVSLPPSPALEITARRLQIRAGRAIYGFDVNSEPAGDKEVLCPTGVSSRSTLPGRDVFFPAFKQATP